MSKKWRSENYEKMILAFQDYDYQAESLRSWYPTLVVAIFTLITIIALKRLQD